MRTLTRTLLLLVIALVCAPALAQDQGKAPLPRVLVLGDSVYNDLSRSVATELKGRVEVVYARWEQEEVANTSTALAHLDRLLGYLDRDGKPLPKDKRPVWDLIHVNFGLGDLIYRAPGMKSFRVMPIHAGGVRTTPVDQYEANLHELIKRLKDTGARIVWASTTPIRASRSNIFKVGSEVAYNEIAAKVMAGHGVPINDMHAYAKARMDMDKPAGFGADPFHFDNAPLHEPVTDVIVEHIGIDFNRAERKQ